MFRFWRRRDGKPSVMYPVLMRVNGWVNVKQHAAADWLNRKVSRYNAPQLKVMLFLFCILFGGCSVYIVLEVFTLSETAIRVTPVKMPLQPGDSLQEIENIYNKLQQSK